MESKQLKLNDYKIRFPFSHQNVERSFSWIIILLLGFQKWSCGGVYSGHLSPCIKNLSLLENIRFPRPQIIKSSASESTSIPLQFSVSWTEMLAENSSNKFDKLCHHTYTKLFLKEAYVLRDKTHVCLFMINTLSVSHICWWVSWTKHTPT